MRFLLIFGLAGWLASLQPAMAAERLLFEDAHARLVEVTHWPGDKITVGTLSLPAIIAADAAWPALSPAGSDAGAASSAVAVPPGDRAYPWCQTLGAQPARSYTVSGKFPLHYYRLEYKRIDGDAYAANWQRWYAGFLKDIPTAVNPGMGPQSGPLLSAEWPFPLSYDAVKAAPANHYLRYADDHVELLEVFIRPGESEFMHGHPYSSVYFDDGGGFYPVIETRNQYLRADSPPFRGAGQTSSGEKFPACYAANPQWPHSVTVTGQVPQHFFRLQFRHMDGDGIKTRGTASYPKDTAQAQIEALERRRTAALASGDAKTLNELLADDYVHVHGTGRVDNRAAFIQNVVERPRESARGPLTIRIHGDTAIVTGEQINRTVNADKSVTTIGYVATQVMRRVQGHWLLESMQLTPKPAN